MILLRRLFLYFLPALLSFYGAGKLTGKLNGFPAKDDTKETIAFLIGLAIINVFVPYSTEKTKNKIKEQDALIGLLLKSLRKNLNDDLEFKLNTAEMGLNIRIFSPKKSVWLWIGRQFHGKRIFVLNDHPTLCVDPIGPLKFKVFPEPEGVVGKVFNDKCMVYDTKLNPQISKNRYNLNPHQNNATARTKFIIASPIFKDGTDEEIIAIVAFDSNKSINLPTNTDWEESIRDSCKIIHKCIPFICKQH